MKKIAILGYGGRGRHYARMCSHMKNDYELMAVIDNSQDKLKTAKADTSLSDAQLFSSLEAFLAAPKVADWLFVCTQDADHHAHAISALNGGYNLLLEKPVACSIEDCLDIEKTAKQKNLRVEVCHVLRYSLYYEKIKEIIDSGALGKLISIEQVENVAYWHQAHSYVRGDWRRKDESTPMIISKCCHDLDIAVYLADSACEKVWAQGRLNFFNKENAPQGATEYCLGGCKAKEKCPYDCEKLYIGTLKHLPEKAISGAWPQSRLMSDGIVTRQKLYDAMKTTRYGKCVFLSDNDVVDYQMTNMLFENGVQSSLIMTAFSGDSFRQTRIRGTLGELDCDMGKNSIMLHIYGQKQKKIKLKVRLDAHGGGDRRLIENLANSSMKSNIERSIESHIIGFGAEMSRLNDGKPIYLKDIRK